MEAKRRNRPPWLCVPHQQPSGGLTSQSMRQGLAGHVCGFRQCFWATLGWSLHILCWFFLGLASGAFPQYLGFSKRSRPRGTGPSPTEASIRTTSPALRGAPTRSGIVSVPPRGSHGISGCSCPHPTVPLGTDPPTQGHVAYSSSLKGFKPPQSDYPFPLATDIGAGRVLGPPNN